MGSAKNIDTAKAEFKAAWEALKARTSPEQLAAALPGNEHPGRRLTRIPSRMRARQDGGSPVAKGD
jgi:hypothetical protein